MPGTARSLLAALTFFVFCSTSAQADIIQSSFNGSTAWPSSTITVGQSFTADSSVASLAAIGFRYTDFNSTLADPTVTMTLFEGQGYGGTQLGTVSKVVTTTGVQWEDFDFSGISLTAGDIYSFRIVGGPGSGGFSVNSSGDAYTDGTYLGGAGNPPPFTLDLAFRVLGATAAVPAPASLPVLAFGLAAFGLARRRRHAR